MTEKEQFHASTPTPNQTPPVPICVPAERSKTLSGANWCSSFPGSDSADDLEEPLKQNFYEFFVAMEKAGCRMNIASTFRPPKRAYLMHYCWRISHQNLDPKDVPDQEGVDIEWDHDDVEKSKQAAADMCEVFEINHLKVRPSLTSRHTEGLAVDMNITWSGDLSIMQSNGQMMEIKTEPRNRMNTELHAVGAGYGIIKFSNPPSADKPHWSTDGT